MMTLGDFTAYLRVDHWIQIAASVIYFFQLLALGVPIMIIARENTNSYYVVFSLILFLVSFGITLLIFTPKIIAHRNRTSEEVLRSNRNSRISMVPQPLLLEESHGHGSSSVAQIRERARMSTILRLDTASVGDEERILERDGSVRKNLPHTSTDQGGSTSREDNDQW
mmetsp:Transcript_2437/g.5062  ORF Transcript_2437/g.5062 Transcript_2437/m.5062 type:complete len:168 (+) Transcript_2437:2104-2607(+)